MAVVKLRKKDELDKLVATLTLRVGRKISQQSIIDACIELSTIHIDELEQYFSSKPKMSKKRMEEILAMSDDFDYDTKKTIDEDLYGDN